MLRLRTVFFVRISDRATAIEPARICLAGTLLAPPYGHSLPLNGRLGD
jgi:hypothetical protein